VLSILFGLLVIANPVTGSRTVVYMIASWSLIIGILKVAFGLKVRRLAAAPA
jgi:uncharacterized membrane protein HdeD (DUF308 family)